MGDLMGYTHYWKYTIIPPETMRRISADFARLIPLFYEMNIKLAGSDGVGPPHCSNKKLAFNGFAACGHVSEDLGITWPSKHAGDIKTFEDNKGTGTQKTALSVVSGQWFAGAELNTRTCGGDCSHESFILRVVEQPNKREERGPYSHLLSKPEDRFYFDSCKTAFKPYDLAVQCALIIAQHHINAAKHPFIITSDGGAELWKEAALIVFLELGYKDFKLGA